MRFLSSSLSVCIVVFLSFSCRHSSEPAAEINADIQRSRAERAAQIHSNIVSDLQKLHGGSLNQTWFESKAIFDENWLIQTPAGYWGRAPEKLPQGLACLATDSNCDPDFLRRLCSEEKDCAATHSSCRELAASVAKPDDLAKKMCLGSGDDLIDRLYLTLIAAKSHIDFVSLAAPTGRFWESMINALAFISHKEEAPHIRILFSGKDAMRPNFMNPTDSVLATIMEGVKAKGGQPDKLKLNLGWLANGALSWNHAKIIIVDGQRVISGGHNFYDPDYVSDQPIFDLSLELSGSAAAGVQNYVNALWSKIGSFSYSPAAKGQIASPKFQEAKDGKSRVIGVGRLGSFGNNASDDAFVSLMNSAKDSIYLAQQDVYSYVPVIGKRTSWALGALVDAVLRGVKVRIVQSNEASLQGYGMVDYQDAYSALIAAVEEAAQQRNFVVPGGGELRGYVCKQIEHAPWRFTPNAKSWANGGRIGSHPKLIIVDQAIFYMGSQNFYPANLQEFGFIVGDANITKALLDSFWNPLWAASKGSKAPCQ